MEQQTLSDLTGLCESNRVVFRMLGWDFYRLFNMEFEIWDIADTDTVHSCLHLCIFTDDLTEPAKSRDVIYEIPYPWH